VIISDRQARFRRRPGRVWEALFDSAATEQKREGGASADEDAP